MGAIAHLRSTTVDKETRNQLGEFFGAFDSKARGRPLAITLFASGSTLKDAAVQAAQEQGTELASLRGFTVPEEGYTVALDNDGEVYCDARLETGDASLLPAFDQFDGFGSVDVALPGAMQSLGQLDYPLAPGLYATGVTSALVIVAVVQGHGQVQAIGLAPVSTTAEIAAFFTRMRALSPGQIHVHLLAGDDDIGKEALRQADLHEAQVNFADVGRLRGSCNVAVDRYGRVFFATGAPVDNK
jgi:hypothetical protein